jgi:hypothetical protein
VDVVFSSQRGRAATSTIYCIDLSGKNRIMTETDSGYGSGLIDHCALAQFASFMGHAEKKAPQPKGKPGRAYGATHAGGGMSVELVLART